MDLLISSKSDQFVFMIESHGVRVFQLKSPNAGYRLKKQTNALMKNIDKEFFKLKKI